MPAPDPKEIRRHRDAAKNVFRLTEFLLGRDSNLNTMDRKGYDITCDVLSSEDPVKLSAWLSHLCRCGFFDYGESELERAACQHLMRSAHTVLNDARTTPAEVGAIVDELIGPDPEAEVVDDEDEVVDD